MMHLCLEKLKVGDVIYYRVLSKKNFSMFTYTVILRDNRLTTSCNEPDVKGIEELCEIRTLDFFIKHIVKIVKAS